MKKFSVRLFLVVLFLTNSSLFSNAETKKEEQATPSFIVKKTKQKKVSKNQLKENLGSTMKSLLDECAFISATVGEIFQILGKKINLLFTRKKNVKIDYSKLLQNLALVNENAGSPLKEIGIIQQILSNKVEQLVENKRPFKNATRSFLSNLLDTNQKTLEDFKEKGKFLTNLKMQLNNKGLESTLNLVQEKFKTKLANISAARLQLT